MTKKTLLGISMIFATLCVHAQATQQWVNRYSYKDTAGPWEDTDIGTAVMFDSQKNVIVTGHSMRGGQDIVTIKYNGSGAEQWRQVWNGPPNGGDAANAMAVDGAGNIYIAGFSNGPGNTSTDFITIKYNAAGVKQWDARYFGPENHIDGATQIAVDGSGNVIVSGRSEKDSQSFNIVTVKYDAAGNELWAKSYNGPGNYDDYANGLAVDANGNIYVTGDTRDSTGNAFDAVTIKYDPSGALQWANRYRGPKRDDKLTSIALDPSGNVIVAGSTNVDQAASWMTDYLVIKYDAAGNMIWTKTYNGTGNSSDGAVAVRTDASGCIYAAGISLRSAGTEDYCVVKLNASGDKVWEARYNRATGNSQTLSAMTIDPSANIYVTGSSQGPTGRDYCTVKWDSTGSEKWVNRYNGTGSTGDEAWAIAATAEGVVAVTGQSAGVKSALDYATVMYSDSVNNGFNEFSTKGNLRVIAWPNPATSAVHIAYPAPAGIHANVRMMNLVGEEVNVPTQTEWDGETAVATLDLSALTPGIYFCEVASESGKGVTRIAVQ